MSHSPIIFLIPSSLPLLSLPLNRCSTTSSWYLSSHLWFLRLASAAFVDNWLAEGVDRCWMQWLKDLLFPPCLFYLFLLLPLPVGLSLIVIVFVSLSSSQKCEWEEKFKVWELKILIVLQIEKQYWRELPVAFVFIVSHFFSFLCCFPLKMENFYKNVDNSCTAQGNIIF